MHQLVVFIVCLGAVVFATPNIDTRILGGQNAAPGQFKHMVSLRSFGRHICGGSIIAPTKILTAGHCIHGNQHPLTVIVGETNLQQPGTSYAVSSRVHHADFNPATLENDVAVLTLETPITYNTRVQPITLTDSEPAEGSRVTLSGWGLTSYPGQIPDDLQYVDLTVLGYLRCDSKLINIFRSQQVCTTSPRGTGSCKYDSGGPLINENGVQVGIVSWGIPCATGLPDVFASVTYFREWILAH